ncbi:MAG: 4-hydroxy-tetrahydrodipicolinate reductase [Actinomycetia bacterium]|nr:4-hydroxy-tetrahydrodipicolinate reductase [Actinomycetes bacterium]
MAERIRVALAGATGRTGREVGRAVVAAPDMELVAAIGARHAGEHLGALWGDPDLDVTIVDSVARAAAAAPEVLIDFTEAESAFPRLMEAVARGWSIVVGTTGFRAEQREALARAVAEHQVGAALIANFSVGAWVAERLAEQAARYFTAVEVVEGHHATKKDRPSGTALRMATLLARTWRRDPDDIPVHAIRLPGLVAHQTVIFGAAGQVLSIRHDVHDRSAYADGVLAAVRKMHSLRGRLVDDLGDILQS